LQLLVQKKNFACNLMFLTERLTLVFRVSNAFLTIFFLLKQEYDVHILTAHQVDEEWEPITTGYSPASFSLSILMTLNAIFNHCIKSLV